MKKFYWILVFIGITLQPQCKHGRTMDPLLIEAVQIQEDALKIARRYDSLIDEKWNETTDSIIRHELMTIQTKIKEWKKQRIEIPGIPQDHSLHDHSKHNHNHPEDLGLKPDEMVKVQEEWRNIIKEIGSKIK